jgi:hypothetical protein
MAANSKKASKSTRSSSKSTGTGSSSGSRSSGRGTQRRNSSSNGGGSSQRLSELATKAKLPLIAGGAALAGAVGGAAARKRAANRSGAVAKLRRVSSNLPMGKLDLGKLDLEKVKSAGERMSSVGQQTADIATAMEKTRKKHK